VSQRTGRVAVVTGAGRPGGLGAATAQAFAALGDDVVIVDVARNRPSDIDATGLADDDALAAVLAEVDAAGPGSVRAVNADVRDREQVERAFAEIEATFGRVDVLVNNAGVGFVMGPFLDVTEDDWDVVVDVNLKGVFLCTQAAVRSMVARGEGGRVITIASQAAKSGFPFAAAYTASKHGVVGLTRSLAVELGQHAITVNAVCPNHVTTGLGAWQNEYFSAALGMTLEEYLAAMRARIPLGRPGLPSDTAAACVFLASEGAGYITGEALNVSGGEEVH
jgi:meso-butanediol dehydrogenase/(S,S)-butanediol dehydrogenase/diacetyl reductase